MTKNPSGPLLISEQNLSHAWGRALLHVMDNPGKQIAPLIVSISGFDEQNMPEENLEVREALDRLLESKNQTDIDTVAFTIFPQNYWLIANGDRGEFYATCEDALPWLKARNRHRNGRGLYFERLMQYGDGVPCDGNQLEFIISQYKKRPKTRKSMFQATTFDPARDHINQAQIGFPCLQHVSFVPAPTGELVMNAFYATQQLYDKAYGNFLGLAHLGAFMANSMGLKLDRLNVFTGVEKLERITMKDPDLAKVVDVVRACISKKTTAA